MVTLLQLTSTELGRLWMTYQIKSAVLVTFGQYRDSIIDAEAKSILNSVIIEDKNLSLK